MPRASCAFVRTSRARPGSGDASPPQRPALRRQQDAGGGGKIVGGLVTAEQLAADSARMQAEADEAR